MNLIDIRKIPLLSKQHRIISIWVICVIVFILIYFIQIAGMVSSLRKEKENEEILKQEFAAAVNKEMKLESSLANFKLIKKEYAAWQAKVKPASSALDEINEVLKLAGKNNLIFNRFDPGDEIRVSQYIKIPIDVNIFANYHDFATFISNVANLPSIVVISDFTINNNLDPKVPRNRIIDLHMEMYFKPEANANDKKEPA